MVIAYGATLQAVSAGARARAWFYDYTRNERIMTGFNGHLKVPPTERCRMCFRNFRLPIHFSVVLPLSRSTYTARRSSPLNAVSLSPVSRRVVSESFHFIEKWINFPVGGDAMGRRAHIRRLYIAEYLLSGRGDTCRRDFIVSDISRTLVEIVFRIFSLLCNLYTEEKLNTNG